MPMPDDPRRIPPTERIQPDPHLDLSTGRASGWQIAFVALACLVIVAVVIYGLNNQRTESVTASAPLAETTGAAPAASSAQPPAKMPGESNAPAANDRSGQPQQPALQQTKPGVTPDDSKR